MYFNFNFFLSERKHTKMSRGRTSLGLSPCNILYKSFRKGRHLFCVITKLAVVQHCVGGKHIQFQIPYMVVNGLLFLGFFIDLCV